MPQNRGECRGRTRLTVVAVAWAGLFLAAVPATAGAATTCSFDLALKTLTVTGDPERGSQLQVNDVGQILVYHVVQSGIAVVSCSGGTPTVLNTDTIEVSHEQDGDSDQVTINNPQEFAPGATDEQGGMFNFQDEIEIMLELGGDGDDRLRVFSAPGVIDDTFVLGSEGLNWNPGDPLSDVDIITDDLPGTSGYDVFLGLGNDEFTAQGGFGTGSPVAAPISVFGSEGSDQITTGDGPDEIDAGIGKDSIKGEGGNDDLTGGDGADRLRGGAGHDRLFAKDGKRDRRIDCGPGAADGATRDAKDPPAQSC